MLTTDELRTILEALLCSRPHRDDYDAQLRHHEAIQVCLRSINAKEGTIL